MMTLGEAAKQAGISKSTLSRAIKSGRVSAFRTDDGAFSIDPAELFRVYPPQHATHVGNGSMTRGATPSATDATPAENAALKAEIEGLKAQLSLMKEHADDLKSQRDGWQKQAEAAQRLLSDHRPAPSGIFNFLRKGR